MTRSLKDALVRLLDKRGYRMVQSPVDMEDEFLRLYERFREATMVSLESMYAIYQATRYVVRNEIPGSLVQCGVWKGGSAMLLASTLMTLEAEQREIVLVDTFSGMVEPSEVDVHGRSRKPASATWEAHRAEDINHWAYAPLDEVITNMGATGYPPDLIRYVVGKVEVTLPTEAPEEIALLHLDTDWYESTHHELLHLFPRLSIDGVLIVDDYGGWLGARKAVDDYFEEQGLYPLLDRIDWSARLMIKRAYDQRPDRDA